MAIAPNTQEFYNLKQSVESLIDAGTITNRRELRAFLDQNDVNFDKFMEVDKEYERRKKLGLLERDTTFSPGKVIGAGVGKVAEDIGDITGDAIEFIAGKEARETASGAISATLDFVDANLPTTLTYAAKETFDPRRSGAEDIGAEIAAFAAPAGALTKATKFIKPKTRLGKAGKYGAIGVGADVLARNDDETIAKTVIDLVPESEEYLQKLVIDPEDTVAERRLKQTIDAALLTGVLGGVVGLTFEKIIRGSRRIFGRAAAQADDVTKPISRSRTATASEARVTEPSPAEFRQSGKIKQVVGKINTGIGRILTSTAGLPQPLFKSYIQKQQFVQASDALIRKEAKQLEKLLKSTNVDKNLVNKLLSGEKLTQQQMAQIPEEVLQVVKSMTDKINKNSLLIKSLLELPEDNKLGMILDPATGGAYLTRTFEFTTNPKWSKDVAKAIKHELPNTPHNADVIDAVQRARIHIARTNPDLTPTQIDGILMNIIDRGRKDSSFNILGEFIQNGMGGPSAKILAGRKDLDKPILDFLGEVKDPVRNFTETMTNQNKLIAKARYLQDIKKFAEENLGKEVKLGGILPFAPRSVATFLRKAEFSADKDVRESLGSLAEKELGAFGAGGQAVGLNKFVTTKEFTDMLEKGIDTFSVDNPVGKGWLHLFAKPAAVGQAMETVFDHTAHLLNTYGMFQQLAMNGVLYRPQIFKESYKAAYAMYQKAAKGDEETLKFLQALKTRGIIDSSITSEAIKKNIDRFGENLNNIEGTVEKAFKAPFRGFSAAYGAVDDFGKITAFQAEYAAYKKAFPNLTDEEIFDMATEVVRNTMPSYTTAAPVVRALTRMPFGTYATFPAEMIRTTKNILSLGARDVSQGLKTGNTAQVRIGMRRLAGIGATTAAIEAAIINQNNQMGVEDADKRAVNLVVPEYQVNTEKLFTQPFIEDPETGDIMTRFVDTGFIDSMQIIKGPVRKVIGRILAGEEVTQREIDDLLPDITRELTSPYFSEKFLTTAVLNALRGVDQEGNPLSKEERIKQIGKIFLPGSIKAGQKLANAKQSEMLRGEGRGQTAAGFPNRVGEYGVSLFPPKFKPTEQAGFVATGIRNNTMNFDKSVSYSLYQDQKIINESEQKFKDLLRSIPDRQLTEDDLKTIYDGYVEIQLEKREAMARMSDKVKVFSNVHFYKKEKDGKMYRYKYDIDGVIKAATSKGKYKVNPNLLAALHKGPDGQGVFIPDSLNNKEVLALIQERKFPPSVINDLKRIEAELRTLPLRKVESDG